MAKWDGKKEKSLFMEKQAIVGYDWHHIFMFSRVKQSTPLFFCVIILGTY